MENDDTLLLPYDEEGFRSSFATAFASVKTLYQKVSEAGQDLSVIVAKGLGEEAQHAIARCTALAGGSTEGAVWSDTLALGATLFDVVDHAAETLMKAHAGHTKTAEANVKIAIDKLVAVVGNFPWPGERQFDVTSLLDDAVRTKDRVAATRFEIKIVQTLKKYPQVVKQKELFDSFVKTFKLCPAVCGRTCKRP